MFDSKIPIHVVGAGLAGVEAAWQIAKKQIPVILHEMRPYNRSEAHKTDYLAELVCSNSFRSDDSINNAVGLLHHEMRKMGSLVMECGDIHKIPAGSAMAVDRDNFSKSIQEKITKNPFIKLIREEVSHIPDNWNQTIISTGPLTSKNFSNYIIKITGNDYLDFFDAIAPIVYKDSIDFNKAWYQSRYDKSNFNGDGKDYINCPLNKNEYENLVNKLIRSDNVEFKEWEKNTPYFESCLPIEEMAKRGKETLRWGPLKPIGLTNPHNKSEKPWAVVQLRQDNKLATLYNIVGFQTKIKYKSQLDIIRSIPGLNNAEFARLGGIHRNTFIKSPKLLDKFLRLKNNTKITFAGQITGVEGYVESSAIGILAGIFSASDYKNKNIKIPPENTAFGSLLKHIVENASVNTFQPMNVNFGLFPPIRDKIKKKDRKEFFTNRAKKDFSSWYEHIYEN
ncbi:MAG: Methylenetetrahydrofolate--tRNA-(uracil-5-)-methyltransferase TrmFO [Alphaproteobacteria bacterium MarineAlpha2_Bin1]|nr:MAG: Methylenetetrahydrofolate--tRNA-(uracil-5-)-methyltransferase TrmFO [Alphaproteobacteria bacterium MarineAlpha2_Bin1]